MIRLHAEVMYVRQLWKTVITDLCHGAHHYDVPFRLPPGNALDKIEIHAFVNHTEEADARMWYCFLIRRVDRIQPRFVKMFGIDAACKRMYIRMSVLFRFIQTVATSENKIRYPEQLLFAILQRLRSKLEGRKLIHTITYDKRRIEMIAHR